MNILIMRGLPGSGKSRYVEKMKNTYTVVCSVDDYFYNSHTKEWRFNPKDLPQAHNECYRKFLQYGTTRAFENIIVDNTNISAWEISPYYRFAETYGHDVKIIRIECPPEVCARRNQHQIPDKVIFDMYSRLRSETLPPWWKEEVLLAEGY